MIVLRAMFGQDEANHGTTRYCVGPDRLVVVPREAAEPLLKRGGFAVAPVATLDRSLAKPSPRSASLGLVAMRHRSARGCSYGGRRYCADESGIVRVPVQAVAELTGHGFVPDLAAPPTTTATDNGIPSENC